MSGGEGTSVRWLVDQHGVYCHDIGTSDAFYIVQNLSKKLNKMT
jgi:hypothetical protein